MTETADRLAILDLLARYARGIDRCDAETLNAIWADAATVDYGNGVADARKWAAGVLEMLRSMSRTQHMLGQTLIDFTESGAQAETLCHAWHETPGPEGPIEMVVGGRYLDDLVRMPAGWRIRHRRFVMDWNRNGPSTAEWDGPFFGALARRGQRSPDDPLYTGL